MVQTDISQLSAECTEWRQILRNYREEFQNSRRALQEICRQSLSKERLADVEHFDNQFHIQLINIHDLKQSIKTHERNIARDTSVVDNVPESQFAHHEELLDEFIRLESMLQDLRNEFKHFISRISC